MTHEQADFDAIAALCSASLLYEGTLPVLPRRINRNGRSFLTLYGMDLGFLDLRDLPQAAVELVTLVDTQSLVTLKGMSEQTQVRVFDHHPLRKSNPKDWDVTTFDLGATTTYFTELLQAEGETLTPIQATLLLLGIYEDTGALTYARTTARDVRAAAWLLEQGADLRIAADFLNPPLSSEQRKVYDQLVAHSETHEIHGHRVVLACGNVENLVEEVSTLAHKLRDLLDPEALFVLVKTIEGVRLVARSTSDDIDVGAVAAHFGGGGHDRAAAALIKALPGSEKSAPQGISVETVRDELLTVLPQYVRPPQVVAQIMSRRPRTIPPTTSAQEAANLMARYGYEGFPVVSNGQVVGLLTRRVVDRALSHRLNLSAASLMEAGEVTVQPSDSIQRVQTLMIDSGWGQIPVVEPESQKIVGIVTRTDLLKTLARKPGRHAQPRSLAEKLRQFVPAERLALIRAVAETAASQHLPVYIVGGFVRDLLLGHPSLDFDIVVEGDAIALAKALVAQHGGKLTSHSRFGTAKWFLGNSVFGDRDKPRAPHANPQSPIPDSLDLISSRQEFYEHPSALPTVEHGSIKLDLHRRDFTINTLALRLDGRHFGELHDHYGGLPDLERRLVRVLHSLSFIDDPTRMLRAVRYEQRYGFKIEPRTGQLMDEARPLVARLSHERARHELDLILDEPKAGAMLGRLDELGLLKALVEVLPWNADLRSRLDTALRHSPPPEWGRLLPANGLPFRRALAYLLWLLDLPLEALEAVQARLVFPVALYKALLAASALRTALPTLRGAAPSQWVQRLEGSPLLALYAVYLVSWETSLEAYVLRWQYIQPKSDGETLKALGLPPGPVYQDILWKLRAAWLDGAVTNDEQEQALLAGLLKELGYDG